MTNRNKEMRSKRLEPELLDTITYENQHRVEVTILLHQWYPNLFVVSLKIGNRTTTRSFTTEQAANTHICDLQRGN